MATIKTMHDAFLHELADTYDAEHQLLSAMQEMLPMAQQTATKQGLEQHIKETQTQIKNLDQVFKGLGEQPKRESCKGVAGIISENKSVLKSIKEPALTDAAIAAGSLKAEHYEIASYRSLVSDAQLMGHADAVRLLQQNLQMEESFASKVEQLSEQLGQQLISRGKAIVGHDVQPSMGHMGAGRAGMSDADSAGANQI